MPPTRKPQVKIVYRGDAILELDNGILLSTEDEDLIPFIYFKLGSNGRYVRLRGNYPHWNQDASLHSVVCSRKEQKLDDKYVVDHIDNNRLNNTRDNLTYADTRTNSTKDRKESSKYYRVSYSKHKDRWRVCFHVDQGKIEEFGSYKTETEAAYWSDVFAIRFLPANALLNFPDAGDLTRLEALLINSIRPWQQDKPTHLMKHAEETL